MQERRGRAPETLLWWNGGTSEHRQGESFAIRLNENTLTSIRTFVLIVKQELRAMWKQARAQVETAWLCGYAIVFSGRVND